uniref:Uncharacterized protein n=1 Tax=Amphimedon queenslandica TaxID=400682 RepID=A0A1X7TIR0_AMPQE
MVHILNSWELIRILGRRPCTFRAFTCLVQRAERSAAIRILVTPGTVTVGRDIPTLTLRLRDIPTQLLSTRLRESNTVGRGIRGCLFSSIIKTNKRFN